MSISFPRTSTYWCMTAGLFPYNYAVPGQTMNLLINFTAFMESHEAYRPLARALIARGGAACPADDGPRGGRGSRSDRPHPRWGAHPLFTATPSMSKASFIVSGSGGPALAGATTTRIGISNFLANSKSR